MYHRSSLSWAFHVYLQYGCFPPFLHLFFQSLADAYRLRRKPWGCIVPRSLVTQQNSGIGVQHRPWSDNVNLWESQKRRMKYLVLCKSKGKGVKKKIFYNQIKYHGMVLDNRKKYELINSFREYVHTKNTSLLLKSLISWEDPALLR